MTKLSAQQRELLTKAAHQEIATTAEIKPTAANLIKRGFLISVPRADGPSLLLITEPGRAAIGAAPAPLAEAPPRPTTAEVAPKRTGKVPILVELLKRPEGATIQAMMEATGWQAHSVRGALSGAIGKTLGLKVISEKTESGRIYRIAAEGEA